MLVSAFRTAEDCVCMNIAT